MKRCILLPQIDTDQQAYDPDHLLVNLLPITKGGGQQNAISFLKCLPTKNVTVLVNKNSEPLKKICCELCIPHAIINNRFWFEVSNAPRKLFGDSRTCLTLFGPPILSTTSSWTNISGVAYSNLFHHEIPFWSYLPTYKRLYKTLVDAGRRSVVKLADAWIFETSLLCERAVMLGFPQERVFHVPMAVSKLVRESHPTPRHPATATFKENHDITILYLGTSHPNKRQHLLPLIAHELKKSGCRFKFVVTLNRNTAYTKKVFAIAKRLDVEDDIENIGTIPPVDVASTIARCDALILLSRLESFSNNIVEAWGLRKPLIIADESWARMACGDAALPVDAEDPVAAAKTILNFFQDPALIADLVALGTSMLKRHPSAEEKTAMHLEVVDKVKAIGKCPPSLRSLIFGARKKNA